MRFAIALCIVSVVACSSFGQSNDVGQKADLVVETGLTAEYPTCIFSPDGQVMACIDGGRSVKLWNAKTLEFLRAFSLHEMNDRYSFASALAFASTGYRLAVAHRDRTISVVDIETGAIVGGAYTEHPQGADALAFSDDGTLVSADLYGKVVVWDIAKGESVRSFDTDMSPISDVRLSPGGKAAAFFWKELEMRDVETGALKWRSSTNDSMISDIAFSADGSRILCGRQDGNFEILDAETGRLVVKLPRQTSPISAVAVAGNGMSRAAFGREDGVAGVIDVRTGKRLWAGGGMGRLNSIRFTPDGEILATAGKSAIVFRNAANGKEIPSPASHVAPLEWAEIAPDGKRLILAGRDGLMSLEMASSDAVLPLEDSRKGFIVIAFSPDGLTLAAKGRESESVGMWDLKSGRSLLAPGLTSEQRLAAIALAVPALAGTRPPPPTYFRDYANWRPYGDRFSLHDGDNSEIRLFGPLGLVASIFHIDQNDWFVTTPEGRFDTNKDLDNISGIHWILNNRTLEPLPPDIFMRQYYEPHLLSRTLRCHTQRNPDDTDTCDKEFKPLPPIGSINRVQPRVTTSGK